MGYSTEYTVIMYGENLPSVDELVHIVRANSIEMPDCAPSCFVHGIEFNAMRWGWRADMIELSKLLPHVTFRVYGEGEQREDVWNAIFKNGKWVIERAEFLMKDAELPENSGD